MANQFQLAVYRPHTAEMYSIADYLALRDREEADWRPYLGLVGMILKVDDRDWWSHRSSIGDLNRIVLQLEAAHVRLVQGQDAILRSAMDDYDVGAYFLLEPSSQQVVRISLFSIEDTNYSFDYPVSKYPERVEALYKYVRENREQLMKPFHPDWAEQYFRELPFPYTEFLDSIQRETELGRKLYQVLGEEFVPSM